MVFKFVTKILCIAFLALASDVAFCSPTKTLHNRQESSRDCRIFVAKKMISDAIPQEETRAEKILINCIRMQPRNTEAMMLLSKLIEQQVSNGERPIQEINKSFLLVTQAYELEPNNPKARYSFAHSLESVGHFEDAQALIQKTMSEFPDHPQTYIEQAKNLSQKNPQEALLKLHAAAKKGADIDEHYDIILTCARYLSNVNTYTKTLAKLSDEFQIRWLYYKLGTVYLDEKQYELAAQAFQHSILLGDWVEAKLQLAIVQYQGLKNYELALKNLEELIQQNSPNELLSLANQALLYSHYSLALYANGKKEEAAKAAVKVVQMSNNNHEFIKSLAYEYRSQNALSVLKDALEFSSKIDPEFSLSYAFLGEIYKQQKDYQKSIDLLSKAVTLSPSEDSYFALLGSSFYKIKDYNKAIVNLDMALALNPGEPSYLYNKACSLALMGKNKEALFLLKIVLNADENYYDVAQNDEDFKGIRADAALHQEFASLFNQHYDGKWASTDPDT